MAEEQQYRQVAQPQIAVGMAAKGVGQRGDYGQQTEQEEAEDAVGLAAAEDHQTAAEYRAESGAQPQCAPHLGRRDLSGMDAAWDVDGFRRVAALEHVTVVVGQVGQDLQRSRGEQGQQRDPRRERLLPDRQYGAFEHGGEGHQQGAGAYALQPERNASGMHEAQLRKGEVRRIARRHGGASDRWQSGLFPGAAAIANDA
ncbi:hypothetical protein D3C81_1581430 [compost metagenome]